MAKTRLDAIVLRSLTRITRIIVKTVECASIVCAHELVMQRRLYFPTFEPNLRRTFVMSEIISMDFPLVGQGHFLPSSPPLPIPLQVGSPSVRSKPFNPAKGSGNAVSFPSAVRSKTHICAFPAQKRIGWQ